jgi:hypothetical protein
MATTTSTTSARNGRLGAPGLDAPDLEALDPSARAVGQQARLADGLARLRRRTKLVATERWLLVGGSVLVPLGAILVILGWFGAAHTGRLFEQIPYMISGGLFGLVLVIAGSFSYFGYWLARLVSDERQQTGQLLDALERIEGHLANGSTAPRAAATAAPARAPLSSTRPEFVATLTGSLYHLPDCLVVADRSADDLRSVRAGAKGRSPCRICLPPEESADDAAAGPGGRPGDAAVPGGRPGDAMGRGGRPGDAAGEWGRPDDAGSDVAPDPAPRD